MIDPRGGAPSRGSSRPRLPWLLHHFHVHERPESPPVPFGRSPVSRPQAQQVEARAVVADGPRPALGYYGTSLYPLRLGSRYGGTATKDPRKLGSFVYVELQDP